MKVYIIEHLESHQLYLTVADDQEHAILKMQFQLRPGTFRILDDYSVSFLSDRCPAPLMAVSVPQIEYKRKAV